VNIFLLDKDPIKCAQYHCDSHVIKMILESAQLLSTAHHVLGGDGGVYKKTHENHPCAVWVRETRANYCYLWFLMTCLGKEYTYRYGKTHKTLVDHKDTLANPPGKLQGVLVSDLPKCMPEHCKSEDVVESYRNYYVKEKSDLLKYTKREIPLWVKKKRDMIDSTWI
jgi:hypothetical protein